MPNTPSSFSRLVFTSDVWMHEGHTSAFLMRDVEPSSMKNLLLPLLTASHAESVWHLHTPIQLAKQPTTHRDRTQNGGRLPIFHVTLLGKLRLR
jgi:hypothetical protein